MQKIEPLNETIEYDVKDFVVAEIVNTLCVAQTNSTNRICVMKKDNNNDKVFYDIVSGIPFLSYEYLFADYNLCRVGTRLPLEYFFPSQDKVTGSELYSFNSELLFDGFNVPQKSANVKKLEFDPKDFF